jgi:hypothetical protein
VLQLKNRGKIIILVVLILLIVPPIRAYLFASKIATDWVIEDAQEKHLTVVGMKVVSVSFILDMGYIPAWAVDVEGGLSRGDGTGYVLGARIYVNAYFGTVEDWIMLV